MNDTATKKSWEVLISTDTEIPVSERTEFTDQMESRLDKLSKRFQELELEQMKKGELQARKVLERVKKGVEEKRTDFENELARARKVSDQAWSEVSEGLRDAWTEMKEAVDRAQGEFDEAYEGVQKKS